MHLVWLFVYFKQRTAYVVRISDWSSDVCSSDLETVHGFRYSFRDWAAEKMSHVPAMVPEMALAHSVGNAVEKAYLRSDLKVLRMQLMSDWGAFVASASQKAVEKRSKN